MMFTDDGQQDVNLATPLQRAGIIVPTYNAARYWPRLHEALKQQGVSAKQVLIVDSSSTDETCALVQALGYRVLSIPKSSFGHGATRQLALSYLPDAEFLIYLTQDAVPTGKVALERLVSGFNDAEVGAVCGRQLPRETAGPIERHARLFNYPATSNFRTFASRNQIGIKAAFLSNSFAAYRRSALKQIGGFPLNTIVNEDMTAAARMLMVGWKVLYQADATAVHSHPFTLRQEFARYFDTGVYHARETWLLEAFGNAGKEGRSFVLSELRYLRKAQPLLIPLAMLRTLNKWLGYQAGVHERHLPLFWKKTFSAQKNFWNADSTVDSAKNSCMPENLANSYKNPHSR